MENLSLQNNQLKEIFILDVPSLLSLDLSENLIEDLSPLFSLEKLYSFRAENNPINVCPLDALSFSCEKLLRKKLSP